jgi:L-alanine-DL-glutamate epimerase-like enolase superfamily enzyme
LRLELDVFRARLRAPFGSAWGSIRERDLLLLGVTDRDGVCGWGEAAPLADYDGIGLDDVRGALEDCRAVLADGDDAPLPELLAACARVAVLPPAIAAVDLALWDLAGRRAGAPVWRLLGAAEPSAVALNATISAPDRSGVAAAAADARAAGFGTVKVKVGIGDDAARLAVARATCGPEMAIRLDANGAWTVEEAIAALEVLAPAGIELCEEPVHGLDAIAAVAAIATVPIAIDESAREPGALDRRVAAAVCLKVASAGGISGLLDAARRARATGYEVYLASTLDGPLGIAAALHAAAVIAPDRPCGLATLGLFETPPDAPMPASGRIAVPPGPGLGDGLRAWYR